MGVIDIKKLALSNGMLMRLCNVCMQARGNKVTEDVLSLAKSVEGVKVTESATMVYLRWKSNGFKCSLDFDQGKKYPLF